jgi:hypothetical protein
MPPILISAPNTDLRTATGTDLVLNTRYPFAKLDSTNKVSFQLINILFLHEPPNPDGLATFFTTVQVYQFPHGYNYIPSTWFLVSTDAMATAVGSEGVIFVGGGDTPSFKSAVLDVTVDDANVYFNIDKYYDKRVTDLGAPNVLGMTLTVRAYVFANDLAGGDVPTQP